MEQSMEKTTEIAESESFDELELLTDGALLKALVANMGHIFKTAKDLNCDPGSLYKRISLTPSLNKQVKEELNSRCGLLMDRSLELIENGLNRGDRGSEKLAMRILERTGMLQQVADRVPIYFGKGKGDSASPENETPSGTEALETWQKKLREADRDENGNIIVGGGEEPKH